MPREENPKGSSTGNQNFDKMDQALVYNQHPPARNAGDLLQLIVEHRCPYCWTESGEEIMQQVLQSQQQHFQWYADDDEISKAQSQMFGRPND